jgi:lipid-A-disaccharide synthase
MLGSVFGKILYYRRAVRKLRSAIRDLRPDVLVPVDSPALNWHLAKEARAAGTSIVHYVAPQVWAWAPWRIKKLRRLTDHVACLLPFEEEYFRSRGVAATYVGHPLFDRLPARIDAADCPDLAEAWCEGTWRIAMLPGSREGEIAAIAPALAAVADEVGRRWDGSQCKFLAADDRSADRIRAAIRRDEVDVVTGDAGSVLADSHFAVVASGTATLEVASYGVPMVIVYNISRWQRMAWRLFVKYMMRTRNLSLVNIIAGRGIVPELMPFFTSPGEVVRSVVSVIKDYGWLCATRQKLLDLTTPMRTNGDQTAAARAAAIVAGIVDK